MPHKILAARILVVDDNPAILRLIGDLLREQGMSVTIAASAAAARQALDECGWRYDLVLSDISMPGESGFDLLQWIKRDDSPNRDLPVLLTTAQLPEAENRIKGLAMGAVDYVVRPIELSELVIRVVNAVEHFQRVRSLEASLKDSADLAMVGRLLAASHHEIKNLAALVQLSSEQTIKLFQEKSTTENEGRALKALAQSSDLLVDIARSVSTLLAPESAVARSLKLAAMVEDVVEMMRSRLSPCWIELDLGEGDVWVSAHGVRVKQVLINLLLNANEAIRELESDSGGHIVVRLRKTTSDAELVVIDNGIGLPAKETRREFQPFSTTKKLRGGQGLGLWLCSILMKNMGGALSLSSEGVGEGASALMSMRLAEPPKSQDFEVERYLAEIEGAE